MEQWVVSRIPFTTSLLSIQSLECLASKGRVNSKTTSASVRYHSISIRCLSASLMFYINTRRVPPVSPKCSKCLSSCAIVCKAVVLRSGSDARLCQKTRSHMSVECNQLIDRHSLSVTRIALHQPLYMSMQLYVCFSFQFIPDSIP